MTGGPYCSLRISFDFSQYTKRIEECMGQNPKPTPMLNSIGECQTLKSLNLQELFIGKDLFKVSPDALAKHINN